MPTDAKDASRNLPKVISVITMEPNVSAAKVRRKGKRMRHGPAAKAMKQGANRRLVTTNHPGKMLNMSASARWPGVVQEKRSHRQNTPNITPNTQNARGPFRSTLLTVLLTSPR